MANDYVGWGLILGIEDSLDEFINDATEVVNSLGTGLPPRDLAAFSSQSTEDGIKLTFTPPAQTYIDDGGTDQFAVMPAGVLIRYSDTGYPRTPDEGKFGYDYKPTGDWVTTSQECTIVGLTKDTKYYFTAFPYSTEHVYNKNQVTANRTEMTWVGNKGTISVTVQTPEGYEGTLGEYTITLVDQAESGGQNETKTVSGAGLTQFGGLTAGKSYKVRLSNTDDLQAPPDSDAVTVVGGQNYDITVTYLHKYGSIVVSITSTPSNMNLGTFDVTLVPQGGGDNIVESGVSSRSVTFDNLVTGTQYKATLSAKNYCTASESQVVTVVGNSSVNATATYTLNFSKTLEQSTWSEIEGIGELGIASEVYSVHDTKNIAAGSETLTVEIVGFNLDDLTSGGKAPYSFLTKHLMADEQQMNTSNTNTGSFKGSALYAYLNSATGCVYDSLPSALKAVIKLVNKKTSAGNQSTTVNTESMKLWIPSVNEVAGTQSGGWVSNSEGTKYPAFTNDASRIKKLSNGSGGSGSVSWWWLRSPHLDASTYFCAVNSAGGAGGSYLASRSGGVCFGFCI